MHSQFPGSAALVSTIFLKNRQDEAFLEFPYALGVQNIATVHLKDKCFQLIFHDASLFRYEFFTAPHLFGRRSRGAG